MIHLNNVTKFYPTTGGRKYVLKNASVDIDRPCNIGIIGRNGAGKSTLMKLLGGVDYPNSGSIEVDGNISWPMGLQAGMQANLSGIDNARFVCRILGESEEQIHEKISIIRESSGLGDYFEMPVKTYSSGMKARLTFWTSMVFNFDIYLMDEIGAVGDQEFRKRSAEALQKKKDEANVIVVSHDLQGLVRDCDVGLYLHDAGISFFEKIEDAVAAYQSDRLN